MSIWLNLFVKEAALLALLGAVGFGLAASLHGSSTIGSRIALAPVFGLALASTVLTTASYFLPMKLAVWLVLLPLACASVALGTRALGREEARASRRPKASDLVQLAVIVLVVTSALNYPLDSRDSVGPIGYTVADSVGYTASIGWLKSHTLRDDEPQATWDLTDQFGAGFARGFQQVGFDTTAAATNAMFGWKASETQSAFMVTLIVVGAFGLFAVVRGLTRTRSWAATLAALLLAGPLAYELFLAGSEAALAGLALIPPLALVGDLIFRDRRPANIAAFVVLAAGLQTVYPLLVAALVLWVAIVLMLKALSAARAHRLSRRAVGRGLGFLAVTATLAIVLSPVAFGRNVTYWHTTATTDYLKTLAATSLPVYDLPAEVIPSYVLQTREFFFLRLSGTSLQQWTLGILVPALLIGLAGYGVWRHRSAWLLLPGIAVAAILAYYTSVANECSYCVQRNMLMAGPIAAALIGVGVAAVGSSARLWSKTAALVIAMAVLVVVGHKSSVMARRAVHGSYTFPSDARDAISELNGRRGPIYLEGIGSALDAVYEMPSFYHAANEATSQRLAVSAESDDYRGLLYLGGPRRRGPEFVPNYRWVLTRAAGIETNRTTVARRGAFALQKRRSPVDATVTSGFAVDAADRDRRGLAWVQGPLTFWVSAINRAPVQLRLEFRGEAATTAGVPAPVHVLARKGAILRLCLPVEGSGDLRKARLRLRLRVPPPRPAPDEFGAPPIPGKVLRLAAMVATTRPCAAAQNRRHRRRQ
jgi:hypothetical protein